jgi:hypothetical protein
MTLFARLYGSRPRHLIAVLVALAFAAYAWTRLVQHGQARDALIWFVAAVLAHDLIMFPLYRLIYELAARAGRVSQHPQTRIPVLVHLIAPAVMSAFLLLAWVPLILQPGKSAASYQRITSTASTPFLGRWLLITAGLFLASAVVYAVRTRRRTRTPHPAG